MTTAAPIPAPMPAFALVDRPLDVEVGEGVGTEDVVVAEARVDVEEGVDVLGRRTDVRVVT
jgi:hypothetical protein